MNLPPGVTAARLATTLARYTRQSTTGRVPGATDDSAAGYAVGHTWLDQHSRIWDAKRITASNAVWQPRAAEALLSADAVSSGLVAAYGVRKLRSAYTGYALRVQRTSDSTTLDVGFRSDGSLDTQPMDAFAAGTTAFVVTWYDQSGNARDATATTTARPTVSPVQNIGPNRGIFFDYWLSNNKTSRFVQALTMPAGVAATSNACSVVSLAAFHHGTANSPLIELSGTPVLCFGNATQTGMTGMALHYSSFSTTQRNLNSFRPPMRPIVSGFASGASNCLMFGDDRSTKTGTAIAGTALAGGLIAGTTVFVTSAVADFGYNSQAALLIYNRQITAAEYKTASEALHTDFRVPLQTRGNIVCDGDSITEGAKSSLFQSWPRQMMPLLTRPAQVHDVAIMGGTFAAASSGTTAVPKWVGLYDSSAPFNILTVSYGTNDLGTDVVSAATLYTRLQAYLAVVQAAGWSVVLSTILPRGLFNSTPAMETERLAYNVLLRANWRTLGCAALIDFANDATMGPTTAAADTTLISDGTHPTDLGYAYMAQIAANTLNTLI